MFRLEKARASTRMGQKVLWKLSTAQENRKSGELIPEEIQETGIEIIRNYQRKYFEKELQTIRKG